MTIRSLPTPLLAITVGRMFRDSRRALGLSQREIEERTGISQSAQSRFERGLASAVDLRALDLLATALGGIVRITFDAPFLVDRAMQRDLVHARCIAYVARRLERFGWTVETEVEIAGSYGPGWIDILAFHPGSGRLLVVEVKTEIHDLGRIQRTLAWYESRSAAAARQRGWQVRTTHAALLILGTEVVDRDLHDNRQLLATAFPVRASELARFLEEPFANVPRRGRSLALIDPLSRRARWIGSTRLDGRRTPSAHADYAAVARALGQGSARRGKGRRQGQRRVAGASATP
jgi:transcriptional regulator with XRE-family HTH domain